ncbi:MAG: hypothetical protein OHK0045_07500 [Raineya sp.]
MKIYKSFVLAILLAFGAYLPALQAREMAFFAEEELCNPENINFEVRLTAPRRFMVLFENTEGNPIYVKIYDMVGNQVAQDVSNQKGRYTKEFDMSNNRSEVFIVEVGNSRNNNTKRVFLQK